MNKNIKIALVGQPNVGKTMLTNVMGKTTLHVGNFTSVTVEKKEIEFKYKDYTISIVDLPGTYMLADYSTEEKITSDFLKNEEYDIILNIIDSTNLERNLQLTSELLNINKKMIIALNMSDEAKKENIEINSNYMSELLGVDAIKVSALTKYGIDHLLSTIVKIHSQPQKESKLIFSEAIEEEITNIVDFLEKNKFDLILKKRGYNNFNSNLSYRKIAIGLISEIKYIYKQLNDEPIWISLQPIVLKAIKHIKIHHDEDAMMDIMADEFMAFNKGIIAETVKTKKVNLEYKTITQKIDSILIHHILGIPIFLLFMWGLFQLTFEIGSIPMDYIDAFFGSLGGSIGGMIDNDNFRSLIVDGLIAGVGAVVLFVPNIVILFIGIALLESTGYMSRVAYLLDGFFHKFGLHGQSFIPLVSGFGCSIPAYMSARILKNDRDRLLTLFIIGFMSCGARLPVYVLFVGAFFSSENAGNILFAIYIGGALLGLIMAKILKMTAFKGESEPFVMEMPKYRMPSLVLIWHTVKSKTMMYLKKAGTFIAAASMLIWFLSNYPQNIKLTEVYGIKIENAINSQKDSLSNELNEKLLEQSYLGQIGKFIEPVFQPLGMDWKMAVALQTGLAAKEVVVSTLGVLYSLGGDVDEENNSLIQRLHDNISFASAVAFIIIMMIYLPCLAATIVFAREAGGVKYAVYLFIFTSIIAYLVAYVGYYLAL
jgi:ferrous iron transport protein B